MLFMRFPVFHKVLILDDLGVDLEVDWESVGSLGQHFEPPGVQWDLSWTKKGPFEKRCPKRLMQGSPEAARLGVRVP